MFLQDDLGHDDVAFYGNEVNLDVTGNITAAARAGIILNRHYVHWHCSPTRRSFLTGRLPLHHSEFLSSVSTGDDIDLRWTTIAEKVKPAGYKTYWFGKGHTGYLSFNHLPLQLGFDEFYGFLGGAMNHFGGARWEGNCPWENTSYSATLFGDLARETLEGYNPSAADAKPLFCACRGPALSALPRPLRLGPALPSLCRVSDTPLACSLPAVAERARALPSAGRLEG